MSKRYFFEDWDTATLAKMLPEIEDKTFRTAKMTGARVSPKTMEAIRAMRELLQKRLDTPESRAALDRVVRRG